MSFIFKAAGDYNKGQADAGAATYNAAIARQNAVIAQQQGEAAAQAQSRDAARKMGSMIASYGASGVQTDSGSPVDVLADSARMATLDNLTTKYNYALKAQGYSNSALLDDSNAENAKTSAKLAMYGDIASGIEQGAQAAAKFA